jgi:hypothetical protein
MQNTDDNNKKSEERQKEKLKRQLERLQICPYCNRLTEFIWVHGHYQCPECRNIIIGCCGDD